MSESLRDVRVVRFVFYHDSNVEVHAFREPIYPDEFIRSHEILQTYPQSQILFYVPKERGLLKYKNHSDHEAHFGDLISNLGKLHLWCDEWSIVDTHTQFIEGQDRDDIDVIIYIQCLGPDGPLPSIVSQQKAFIKASAPWKKALSQGAQPQTFKSRQKDLNAHTLCGRPIYRTATIPPSLISPFVAQFLDDRDTGCPEYEDHQLYRELKQIMCKIYLNEDQRLGELRALLNIGLEPRLIPSTIGDCRTNGDIVLTVDGIRVRTVYLAGKDEVGSPGAEPYFQNILFYEKGVEEVREAEKDCGAAPKTSHFPALLIIVVGDCIGFAGAVYGSRPNVQMLSSLIPLRHAPSDEMTVMQTLRLLFAMRRALVWLNDFYQSPAFLIPSNDIQVDCPYPRSYEPLDGGGTIVNFRYISQIDEDKCAYIVELSTGGRAFVKFVQGNYGKDAHMAAANLGLAPPLLGFQTLPAGWRMIVTTDLSVSHRDFSWVPDARNSVLCTYLTSRLQTWHDNQWVHGDLRDVNIMVQRDDPNKGYVIDWDWAGKEGHSYYPTFLNVGKMLWRPDDVVDGVPILRRHDEEMIRRAFYEC